MTAQSSILPLLSASSDYNHVNLHTSGVCNISILKHVNLER